jgi:hypothetical protein
MTVKLIINGAESEYHEVSKTLINAIIEAKKIGNFVGKRPDGTVISNDDYPITDGTMIIEEVNVAKL